MCAPQVVRSPTTPSSTSGSSDSLIPRKASSHLGEPSGTAAKVASVYSVLEFTEADIKVATQDYSPDQQLGSGGFVTSTIVHDVDKCTRSRLCGAARLDFDDIHDVFRNARLKFKY